MKKINYEPPNEILIDNYKLTYKQKLSKIIIPIYVNKENIVL